MPQIQSKIKMGSGESYRYIIDGSDNAAYSNLEKYLKISEIKKIIGRKTIYPRFRIFVLNPDETICYQIPNEDILSGGSYSENYQNGARRTLSFSLNNQNGKYTPSINNFWTNTKVLLDVGIEIPDEEIIIWFHKGVYIITSANPSKSTENKTVSISCADKFEVLSGRRVTVRETVEVPVGSVIKDVIRDALLYDGGVGEPLDPTPFFYHPSFEGKVTPISVSISSGSNYGELITQLANILSAEVFYDSYGSLNFIPINEAISDGEKPNLWDYSISNLQNEDFSINLNEFVNCVYVVGANINGYTYTSIRKNEDPSSPISVGRIGLRVGDIINDSNITTQQLADERAEYELRKKIIAESTLSSSAIFNPLLSVNNIVTYTDKEDFQLERDRFLIQSISFNLGYDGTMSLSVSNLNNLPFVS